MAAKSGRSVSLGEGLEVHITEPAAAVSEVRTARTRIGSGTYRDFVAKESRLRPDQLRDLDELARELGQLRRAGEKRITANTLIRVAVDNLLTRRAMLTGTTESELRNQLLQNQGLLES